MRILILVLLFPFISFSQKIVEDKVDDFTKKHIKRTDYETITSVQYLGVHYRISKIDNERFFELKMVLSPYKMFAIQKGQKLMFKSVSGEVMELESITSEVSCLGCGAIGLIGSKSQGLKTAYLLTDENVKFLFENKIDKIRINTSLGFQDIDLKEKKYLKLKTALELINND